MNAAKAVSLAASALSRCADILFPRICPVCGELSDRPRRLVCWNCMSAMGREASAGIVCQICGGMVGKGSVDGLCHACRRRRPHFDIARSALVYEGPQRRLVHGFKYNGWTWLADDLADMLEATARASFDLREVDVVLPVPLHPAKFIMRRYNQSALLARKLARRTRLPFSSDLLKRVRDTGTQTRLGRHMRERNVSGAFLATCPGAVRARTILLVDDVMTTGATAGEIAKTLKAAGAWRVWALALCRANVAI